jgi:hypothetical protein
MEVQDSKILRSSFPETGWDESDRCCTVDSRRIREKYIGKYVSSIDSIVCSCTHKTKQWTNAHQRYHDTSYFSVHHNIHANTLFLLLRWLFHNSYFHFCSTRILIISNTMNHRWVNDQQPIKILIQPLKQMIYNLGFFFIFFEK